MFMRDQTGFTSLTVLPVSPREAPGRSGGRGLLGGARVETDRGWMDVRSVMPGMRIATLDGGFALLRGLSARLTGGRETAVTIPGGALGNCADLTVMPGSGILLSDPLAEDLFGSADVIVPAAALCGHRGIGCGEVPQGQAVVELHFDAEEAVYANTGVLLHMEPAGGRDRPSDFTWLTEAQARALIALAAREVRLAA